MASEDCSLCLSTLTNPKILPCGHSCCLECLLGWVKAKKKHGQDQLKGQGQPQGQPQENDEAQGQLGQVYNEATGPPKQQSEGIFKLQCPECLYFWSSPLNDIESLLDISQSTTTASTSVCGDCEKQPRELKCVECNYWLCKECSSLHQKIRATRNHHLLPVAKVQDGSFKHMVNRRKPQFLPCKKHEDSLKKYFCINCSRAICSDCWRIEHVGHDKVKMEEIAKVMLDELDKQNKAIMVVIGRFKSYLERLNTWKAEEETNAKIAIEDINARKDEIIEEIQNIAERSISRVKEVASHRDQKFEEMERDLRGKVEIMESFPQRPDFEEMKTYEIVENLYKRRMFKTPRLYEEQTVNKYKLNHEPRQDLGNDTYSDSLALKSIFGELFIGDLLQDL